MEIDAEVEKVENAKQKIVEFKNEILKQVDEAQLIISEARTQIESSKILKAKD